MSNFTKQTTHQTSSVFKSYSSMSFILIHLQMNASLATRYSKQASCLGATHTPGVFQYHDLWLFCVFQGTGTTNPCILFICTNAINFKALDEIHIHGLFSKGLHWGVFCVDLSSLVIGKFYGVFLVFLLFAFHYRKFWFFVFLCRVIYLFPMV